MASAQFDNDQAASTRSDAGGARALSERFRLRLAPAQEKDYMRYNAERSIALLRFSMSVAVVLYVVFLTLDLLTQKRLTDPLVFLLVFGVSCPSALIVLAATLHPRWRQYAATLAPYAVIANGMTLICIIALCTHRGIGFPYEVLILNLMYAFFLTGILFRVAVPIAISIVVTYLAADTWAGLRLPLLVDHGFVLFAVVALGAIASYAREKLQRHSWLQERQLRELSQHDPLAGLFNHRVFFERGALLIRQARREKKSVALLMVDVDQFKRFNDTHGHLAGDDCLRRLSAELDGAARRPMDLAARLGGDEFAVLLYDATQEWAQVCAEDLRLKVAGMDIAYISGVHLRITISIGIACGTAGGMPEIDRLTGAADAALYRAKSAGRDRVSL